MFAYDRFRDLTSNFVNWYEITWESNIIKILNGYIAVYDHKDETTYKAGNCLS